MGIKGLIIPDEECRKTIPKKNHNAKSEKGYLFREPIKTEMN